MSSRSFTSAQATAGVARSLIAILAFSYGLKVAHGQVACDPSFIQADAGPSWRWPVQNPGMVAPVAVNWLYPKFTNPLPLTFTGKSFALNLPTSYTGGFNLSAPDKPATTDEQYQLTRVELRKPAQIPEGAGQVLSHQWEMVLIHKEAQGVYWANVVVPFSTTTSGAVMDIVNPIIEDVKLPTDVGAQVPAMASSTSQLYLDPVFESTEYANTTFSTFWSKAECDGCPSKTVPTRMLLRSAVLGIGMDSAQQLTNALMKVPSQAPSETAGLEVWIIDPCKNGTKCMIQKAEDLSTAETNAKAVQSAAVDEQRSRKARLDELLPSVANHTGPATRTSIATFQEAVAADMALRAAVAQLNSAENTVSQVTAWAKQAKTAKWDADKPAANTSASFVVNASSSASNASFLMMDAMRAPVAAAERPLAMGGMLSDVHVAPAQAQDCSSLGRSPIDINLAQVVDPERVSPGLREPLSFKHVMLQVDAQPPLLQVENLGQQLRVSPPAGAVGWPLGAVFLDGQDRGISYVDVHVPGQHTLNGRPSAAELQLVHQSTNGQAVAVAVPLEVDGEQVGDNEWLKSLLSAALPGPFKHKQASGRPLGELHSALAAGSTGRYYRYDGTLTASPCLPAEWYVLQDAGAISESQLLAIRSAIQPDEKQRFQASLIMEGTHTLVTQVGSAGRSFLQRHGKSGGGLAQALGTARFRGRRRLQV